MALAEPDLEAQVTTAGGISACPACVVAPSAERIAQMRAAAAQDARIMLSLPAAHCAACISTVEGRLNAFPGCQVQPAEPDDEAGVRRCRGRR
jgi:hypothetical protein